jgi:hypothetical protein
VPESSFLDACRRIPILREAIRLADSITTIKNTLISIDRSLKLQHELAAIRLFDFDLLNHPRYSDPKRLLRYSLQGCSMSGEDGMIHEIFRRIGTSNQTFVEIGVGDGNENNTAFLIAKGWNGFWFDGDPKFLETIRRNGWDQGKRVSGAAALVSKENISEILGKAGVPKEFDLLSIDIDQNTYHIWQALSHLRPRVVVVEYNAAFPPDMEWIVPYDANAVWDGTQNFGASLNAYQALGDSMGYDLVGCDFLGANAFFVLKELCGDKFASPFTAENHYEPLRYPALARRGHTTRAFPFNPDRK